VPDGSAYDGEWADGLRDGRGTLFLASGDQFTGPWCVRDTHTHTHTHTNTHMRLCDRVSESVCDSVLTRDRDRYRDGQRDGQREP
jgi:hypothetical protein